MTGGSGKEIDRGLDYVCGSEPYGGEHGCGLYFCGGHRRYGDQDDCPRLCERCLAGADPFEPTPDVAEWIGHKLTDESWAQWRSENPDEVAAMTSSSAALASAHEGQPTHGTNQKPFPNKGMKP